jgi:hypothetical protein
VADDEAKGAQAANDGGKAGENPNGGPGHAVAEGGKEMTPPPPPPGGAVAEAGNEMTPPPPPPPPPSGGAVAEAGNEMTPPPPPPSFADVMTAASASATTSALDGPASVAVFAASGAVGVAAGSESRQWELGIEAPRWSMTSKERQNSILWLAVLASALLIGLAGGLLGALLNSGTPASKQPSTVISIGLIIGACLAIVGAAGIMILANRGQTFQMKATAGPPSTKPSSDSSPNESGTSKVSGSESSGGPKTVAPSPSSTHGGGTSSQSKKDPKTTVSPKVISGGVAGAVSTAFWTIAAATFWHNSTFDKPTIAVLAAATTTILATSAAYLRNDELRVAKVVTSRQMEKHELLD